MRTHFIPARPIPYADESPASLLIRAAEANGHSSVFQLVSQVRRISSPETLIAHWADPKRYRALIQALGLGDKAANLAWFRSGPTSRSPRLYNGLPVAESLFTLDGTRFCPLCLSEAPYWRRQWTILPLAGCIEHRCLLLDRCNTCGKSLNVGRGHLRRCNHCHALLATKAPRIEPTPLRVLTSLFEQKNTTAVTTLLTFWEALMQFDGKGNSPTVAFERLALAVAWHNDQPAVIEQIVDQLILEKATHPRIRMLPFLTGGSVMNEFAEQVLTRVPSSDWQYIRDKPNPGALTKREVCAVLRISAVELTTLIRTGSIAWPKEGGRQPKIPLCQIESYLDRQRLPSNPLKTKSDQVTLAVDDGWFDVQMLGLRWQVHPEVIRSLIAAKWLSGRNRTVQRCRKMMVSFDEVSAFEQQFALVGTLAREWGVNSTNLAEKLKSLGIKAIGGPGIDRVLTSLFRLKDVLDINAIKLNAIDHYPTNSGRKRKTESLPPIQREGLASTEVAEMLGISIQQVAVLLRRGVLRRTTKVYRPTRIDRASYWKLSRILQREDLLSIDAAAELLGVRTPSFRANWVATGIIRVIDLGIWRFVTRGDVETAKQLRGKYVTATEAGRMLGMHRTHMLNLEKQGLVEPLRFGKNKKLRLYERKMIRDLARRQHDALNGRDGDIPQEEPSLLSKNQSEKLPLSEVKAESGGPPRLTWACFWTGKLEGWEEAEEQGN